MRLVFACGLALLLLLVGCAAQEKIATMETSSEPTPVSSDQPETLVDDAEIVKVTRASSAPLDCAKVLLDADIQKACPDVAAEDFTVMPLEDESGKPSGCSYAKGASDVFISINLPEVGVEQAIENEKAGALAWDGKEPESFDIGVKSYYARQPRVRLFFGKSAYFVDILAGVPDVELCTVDGLQALGRTIVKNLG